MMYYNNRSSGMPVMVYTVINAVMIYTAVMTWMITSVCLPDMTNIAVYFFMISYCSTVIGFCFCRFATKNVFGYFMSFGSFFGHVVMKISFFLRGCLCHYTGADEKRCQYKIY